MDWSRCDEIEYDCQYENNNIIQTGKEYFAFVERFDAKHAEADPSKVSAQIGEIRLKRETFIETRLKPFLSSCECSIAAIKRFF